MFISTRLDDYNRPALRSLFLDVTVLAIIIVITAVFNWSEIFDESQIDFNLLIAGICLFTLFWFLLGLWFILAAQSVSRNWSQAEA
jgi:chromate transport protein ChrA